MSHWRYLLDTNIVSQMVRDPTGIVYRRVKSVGSLGICTSAVVACELRYGAIKKRSQRLQDQLNAVLTMLPVVPFDGDVDFHYACIRADLESAGTPIGSQTTSSSPLTL